MQDNVTTRNKSFENFLVAFMVFEIFWSYFTGFSFWFGGAVAQIINGRLIFLSKILLWIVFIIGVSKYPSIATKKNMSYGVAYVIILLLTWMFTLINCGIPANSLIVWAFNGFVIISMNDHLKLRCFDIFARWLAVMLVPAMAEYIIYELTGFGIVTAQGVQRGTYDIYLDQLLLNFLTTNYPIQRFQFLTEEPGLVGTCCAFMLFALKGKPQYRIQYIIYLIAGLLTFSFAYYVLLAIHVVLSWGVTGVKFRYIVIFAATGFIFYYYFSEYLDILVNSRI